jgi:hypothetical protein
MSVRAAGNVGIKKLKTLPIWLTRKDKMKVKDLIKILKKAPQDIDVDIFDYSTEYLLPINKVWIPKKEDMEDNPEVQITINKNSSLE